MKTFIFVMLMSVNTFAGGIKFHEFDSVVIKKEAKLDDHDKFCGIKDGMTGTVVELYGSENNHEYEIRVNVENNRYLHMCFSKFKADELELDK